MSLKKLGTAIVVVAVLGAVLASSAFATATPNEVNWQKGESPYQTLVTEPLAVTTEQVGSATIVLNKGGLEIVVHASGVECQGCRITNEGRGGGGYGALKFTGVTVQKPASCTTPSTFTTRGLSFSANSEEGGAELLNVQPVVGPFFYLGLRGAECPFSEELVVEGSLSGKFANKIGVQATTQPVAFSGSLGLAGGTGGSFMTATENLKAGGTYFGVSPGGVVLSEATQTAAKWYTGATEGGVTELAGSQAVTAEQAGSSTFATTVSGQEVVVNATGVECLECKISNSPTGGSGTGKLKFTGVTVEKPAGCTTASTITTNSLSLAANWAQGEIALVKVTPVAGEEKPFESIALSGSGCSLATTIVPKGSLFGAFTNKQGVQATSQTVRFMPTINSNAGGYLHVGTEPATLTATDVFKAGGLYFGVK